MDAGAGEVVLLGACQGLTGEARRTAQAILELAPTTVALALDPEIADRVEELEPGSRFSVEDAAYRRGLSEWGEVQLPPPEYEAATLAAEEVDADVEGVDMPEPAFMERYTDLVSVLDLTRRAFRVRWMKAWPPSADSPKAFCTRFDEKLNKGPFGELERVREREIARRLREVAEDGSVACVLEVQRLDGVRRALAAPHVAP